MNTTARARLRAAGAIAAAIVLVGCNPAPEGLFNNSGGTQYDGSLLLQERQTIADYDQAIAPIFDQVQTELAALGVGQLTAVDTAQSYTCPSGGVFHYGPHLEGKAIDFYQAAELGNQMLPSLGFIRVRGNAIDGNAGYWWSWADPLNGGDIQIIINQTDNTTTIGYVSGCRPSTRITTNR